MLADILAPRFSRYSSYYYLSYALWTFGSIGVGVLISHTFPRMAKALCSILGIVTASVGVFLSLPLGLDHFMADQISSSFSFPPLAYESWDLAYHWTVNLLLNLLPAYYAFRYLTTSGKDSWKFALVPLLVGTFISFVF